jgi:hypothetical protein
MTRNTIKCLGILVILSCITFNLSCKSSISSNKQENDTTHFLLKDVPASMTSVTKGTLNKLELLRLKNNLKIVYDIDLDEIKYLTISYLKSRNDCWYENQYKLNSYKSNSWRNNIRENLNSEILFLHIDLGHKPGESKLDKGEFIYNLFPESKGYGYCDFTISLSHTGKYYFKKSHFFEDFANAFKNELIILDSENKE